MYALHVPYYNKEQAQQGQEENQVSLTTTLVEYGASVWVPVHLCFGMFIHKTAQPAAWGKGVCEGSLTNKFVPVFVAAGTPQHPFKSH